jgi:hypothetical protein
MSTTLTGLIPDLYESLDIVSRELVGFIPSVTLDTSVDRAAVGQNVRNPITPAAAATNITPGVTPPDDGNQTISNVPIALSKARRVPIRWTGEQERGANTGVGAQNIRVMQISQAMRTLCNEIEADLAALHITTSRAVGTAGTTPFASNLTDPAQARRVLVRQQARIGAEDAQIGEAQLFGERIAIGERFAENLLGVDEDHRHVLVDRGDKIEQHGGFAAE